MNWDCYNDPDDCEYDWRTLRQSTHTARKYHHCDSCDCGIQPGQRYGYMPHLQSGSVVQTSDHESYRVLETVAEIDRAIDDVSDNFTGLNRGECS